jgi:cyclophilin family peptidyl-prolyl cis-trans isomerase
MEWKVKNEPKITDQVYFTIDINGTYAGRIVFGLFGDIVPKTVENFKLLSIRDKTGEGYHGTKINRVSKGLLLQGGDIDGNGGKSAFSVKYFNDESFKLRHTEPYLLSMANEGRKNSNGSQFFITLTKMEWLDEKHVVFGKVLEGIHIIKYIEKLDVDENDIPLKSIVISEAGILPNVNKIFQ